MFLALVSPRELVSSLCKPKSRCIRKTSSSNKINFWLRLLGSKTKLTPDSVLALMKDCLPHKVFFCLQFIKSHLQYIWRRTPLHHAIFKVRYLGLLAIDVEIMLLYDDRAGVANLYAPSLYHVSHGKKNYNFYQV